MGIKNKIAALLAAITIITGMTAAAPWEGASAYMERVGIGSQGLSLKHKTCRIGGISIQPGKTTLGNIARATSFTVYNAETEQADTAKERKALKAQIGSRKYNAAVKVNGAVTGWYAYAKGKKVKLSKETAAGGSVYVLEDRNSRRYYAYTEKSGTRPIGEIQVERVSAARWLPESPEYGSIDEGGQELAYLGPESGQDYYIASAFSISNAPSYSDFTAVMKDRLSGAGAEDVRIEQYDAYYSSMESKSELKSVMIIPLDTEGKAGACSRLVITYTYERSADGKAGSCTGIRFAAYTNKEFSEKKLTKAISSGTKKGKLYLDTEMSPVRASLNGKQLALGKTTLGEASAMGIKVRINGKLVDVATAKGKYSEKTDAVLICGSKSYKVTFVPGTGRLKNIVIASVDASSMGSEDYCLKETFSRANAPSMSSFEDGILKKISVNSARITVTETASTDGQAVTYAVSYRKQLICEYDYNKKSKACTAVRCALAGQCS